MNRRRYLVSITASVGVGGCLSGRNSGDHYSIGSVTVLNRDSEAHVVDLRVTDDGETLYDERFRIPEGTESDPGSAFADRRLPDGEGEFVVNGRVDGGSWLEVSPSQGAEYGCLDLLLLIDPDGEYGFMTASCRSSSTETS